MLHVSVWVWTFVFLTINFGGNFQVYGIVNLHQETANPIFYRRIPPTHNRTAWRAGIECINEVSKFYFVRREILIRSNNTIVGYAVNMSTPAAEIQSGYLKLLNEIIEQSRAASEDRNLFLLRVISDIEPYKSSKKQPQGSLHLADFYVIVIDSVERLLELIERNVRRMNSWNPGARFLLLYNNVEEHGFEKNITMEIYRQMLKKFYIHRVTILYAIGAFDYSLTSLDYFSQNACGVIKSQSFGLCKNGKLERESSVLEAEMEKIQNHENSYNCTFNVCATIAAPFVEKDCETGLELSIIRFLRKNLRLNVITTCSESNRGVQNDDEKWSGLLGQLKSGDCDFIIGGYYPDNDILNHFWSSDCYYDDKHTWFIKKAEERPEWMALYTIFDEQAWHCVLIVVPITMLSWYLLARFLPEPESHKEFSLIGINNLAVTICVSVNERPLNLTVRIFWFMLALYGMNIVAICTSRLISVFANPGYLHQIDNIEEVIEEGILFGGPEENHDWFDNDEDMLIYDLYNDSHIFDPNTENLLAVTRGQRVILSNRMYILQHNSSDKLYAFPRNAFSSPMQMIMKPGFPFMYEINLLIRKMRDYGIFEKYYSDFIFNNTYLNRIAKMRPEFLETQIVITTVHLQGPINILILGLLGSSLLFCLEICLKKCKKGERNQRRSKVKRSKNKKKSKNLKNLEKQQYFEGSEIKSRHGEYKETQQNPKFAFVQTKFGSTNRLQDAQIRFTPTYRRKVFNNYGSLEGSKELDSYINGKYS